MRIGFATIYSWRPHVEHTWFLARLAQRAGHETRFLSCDGKLPTCYTRELRNRSTLLECLSCRLGNIKSYTASGVDKLSDYFSERTHAKNLNTEWSISSASTLKRFEAPEDYKSSQFSELVKRIEPSVDLAFEAARNWISREKLDAVCVFNGRMDVTRAIYEAAKQSNVPVVTHERSWFGNGIQLYPEEHCLSLRPVWEMVSRWIEKPLTREQALVAASTGARRFLKVNRTEWRAYNVNARSVKWPVTGTGTKVLILPSSSNEIWGHKDWCCQWTDILSGFEAVLKQLSVRPLSTVLRCHPNWGENIGKQDGSSPERYYSEWAKKSGIHCIGSHENLDTLNLIQQADIVIVSVSSAALEAGLLGKKIITVCPSNYHTAGFTLNIHNQESLPQANEALLREEIIRRTLRFIYTVSCRIPQYVNYVKAESAFGYKYLLGAEPSRFMKMFTDKTLLPDDETYSSQGSQEEASVIQLLQEKKWQDILVQTASNQEGENDSISRRLGYRWLDKMRQFAPVGDQ